MHKRSQIVAAGAVSLSMCLGLSACSLDDVKGALSSVFPTTSVAQARADRVSAMKPTVGNDQLVEAGTLTVGLKQTALPPFSISTSTGSITGLDVDLASAVADQMGLKVNFVQIQTPASAVGKSCDIVMDVKESEDASVKVVGSYAQATTGIFSKGTKGAAATVSTKTITKDDLVSKNIGVQSASVSARAFANASVDATVKNYSNVNDAFAGLAAGDVDFVVCDAYAGAYLAQSQDDPIVFCGTIDAPVNIGIAVSADKSQLQKAVSAALANVQSQGQESLVRAWWIGGMDQITSSSNIIKGQAGSTSEKTSSTEN